MSTILEYSDDFLEKVGSDSTNADINWFYNPKNGDTQIKQKWKSDDISDSNRSTFSILTSGQRDAILGANDNAQVAAAHGVIATPRLKWELKQYELELSDRNSTTIWENGYWNNDGISLFTSEEDRLKYENALIEPIKYAAEASDGVNPNLGPKSFNPTVENSVLSIGEAALDYNSILGSLEFDSTDTIIGQISGGRLQNLKYPEDANFRSGFFGQGSDYTSIRQYSYQAPNRDILQGGNDALGIGLGTNGLNRRSAKKKELGLVRLPMPNQLQDSNNVSWGPDQLDNLTAAVASGVLPLLKPSNIQALASGNFGGWDAIKNKAGKLPAQAKEAWDKIVSAIQTNNNTGLMAQTMIGSKILNMAGFDISAESLLARGYGVIPNSNMELLFNSPALRDFQFNWKMSPRSESEAVQVRKIIKFFKVGMAVKKQSNTGSGQGSYFLGTPNVFQVNFKTGNNDDIDGVARMKECACTSCAINYTPESNWAAYEEGQPVSIIMSLKFSELEPIYDQDYLDLPDEAVGY